MFTIKADLCVMCDACRPVCPRNAVSAHPSEKTYIIDTNACNECANMGAVRCIPQCPTDAIVKK